MDHIVHVFAIDEVVVYLALHFAPPAHLHLFFVINGRVDSEAAIGYGAVGFPLDFYGNTFAGFEVDGEFVGVGVPGGAPAFGDNFFAVNEY